MGKKTPLYDCHIQAHAKMVDFAGWSMPLHYGSQVQEHHIVRTDAGLFDVSHMTIIDCQGGGAAKFLRYLAANNIDRLTPGKALYTCMLNDQGGVIDDLIIYQTDPHDYRLVVNAATRDKDMAWLTQQAASFQVTITERTDLAMLALQGPAVRQKIAPLFMAETLETLLALKPFHAAQCGPYFIARTGYTGEEGFELFLPAATAPAVWAQLLAAGFHPCGLGARDTLRLEAGLNLYGADMDETVTPFESNLGWTVALEPADRLFIGRNALEKQKTEGIARQLIGLVLEQPGVLRNHQKILANDAVVGEITSGSFSPTLNKGIALARVAVDTGPAYVVDIRGKHVTANRVALPFVKKKIAAAVVG